jgi:3',5'-cyclic AMP phosphodiesterase CpdA
MKLLCLSDLHLQSDAVVEAINHDFLSPFLSEIAANICEFSPDAVVVTGDSACPSQVRLILALPRTVIPIYLSS